MGEFEKIAASLRHCAARIGHCRECCEYGEPGCNRLLKEEAAEAIEALLREREERAEEKRRIATGRAAALAMTEERREGLERE